MAVRDALKDDAYEMYGMNDDIQSVDLTVWPWNRATIADGQWLQDHAIGPLSARDVYLADCIESANQSINNIEGILQNIGISTGESGANNIGYATKSLHTLISGPTTLTSQSGWGGKSIALVPKDASDSACFPGSISYLTFGAGAQGTTGLPEGFTSAAVIQANMYSADAYQLAFTPLGLYYRHINGNTTQGMDPVTEHSYSYVTNPQTFSALPMFDTSVPGDYFVHVAGGKATLTASMSNYYTTAQTSGKDQLSTEFAKYYTTANTSGKDQLSNEFAKYYTTGQTSGKDQINDALALKADKSEIPTTVAQLTDSGDYLTTANAASTYLTAVSAKDSIFSGDGTSANPLNASIGANGYYAFWKNGTSISLTEIENTIIQLTSAGTNRQDPLSTWLQRIIDAIAALQPQQQSQD